MRYFIEIAYEGTNYHGWQTQKNSVSVQEVFTDRLRTLIQNKKLDVLGCGRTDTGVHAKQFFLHVDLNNDLDLSEFKFRFNNMLPNDIVLKNVNCVPDYAHARYDAVERTYRYYINQIKDPFKLKYSWYINKELDINRMNDACRNFCKYDDFTSFSKLHTDVKTNICEIKHVTWKKHEGSLIFEITADRFLRNMVRSIVGTMIDIGMKKLDADDIHGIIQSKNRSAAGISAPAQGLFLEEVKYPPEFNLS